jgi:hypothetical protein
MTRYNLIAIILIAIAVMFTVTAATPMPAATVKAGTSVTDSLQALVDSIFAAQNVGQQIDSAAVGTVKALAESYRQAGMSNQFWQYRKAAVKLERQSTESLPAVQPKPVTYTRHKLDI